MAKEAEITTVTMNDGRVVDFAGKQRCKATTLVTPEGALQVHLDYRNGESRVFQIRPDMVNTFALHGAKQKLFDEMAGIKDIDDAVLAVDELVERLDQGEFVMRRASGESIAGTSVLLRALVEYTGKSVAEVKAVLKTKTQMEKLALRNNDKLRPIIERLEMEKAKKSNVDTDALLNEMAA